MTTANITMNLSSDAQSFISQSGTASIVLNRFILSSETTVTEIPTTNCLIDNNPSGASGSYTGTFNNTGTTTFTGRTLIITFTDTTEKIFATGSFPSTPSYTIEPSNSKTIQYSFNLETNDKPILFNTNATYASLIGTLTSHPAIGNSTTPVYVASNGQITACSGSLGNNATDNDMSYSSPTNGYLLIKPTQIKTMIEDAFDAHNLNIVDINGLMSTGTISTDTQS